MGDNCINCALDCCFRMFQHPNNPDFLSDSFLGREEDMSDYRDYAMCTATEEAYKIEITPSQGYYFSDPEYMGGIPNDCPIFQGEIDAPWNISDNEQSA